MNTTTAGAAPQTQDLGNIKRLPILISLIIGAFFSILNETLLNIAFLPLTVELGVSYPTIQWLSTGYLLVVGILVPVTALLVQWFTTRQMFLGAMVLFSLGTLVCALAPGFEMLLIGRLIQAMGTGLMLPVMMNTILVLYPPEKRGAAMGSMGLVIMFAPAIGPTLSGLILEHLDWRWLFYLVLPFAIFSIVFAAIYLKNVSTITRPKVDVLSIILSTIGFGGIVFGFSSAGKSGEFTSPDVYLSMIAGAIALTLFIWRQLRSETPMLDFRAFRFPMFAISTVLLIIAMMSMFATMMLLPIYLQGALVLSTFAAGLLLLPGSVLNGFLAPITGKLFDKFGPRALVIPGSSLLLVVTFLFSRISLETTQSTLVLYHILLMVAISMIMMPTQTNGLNQLPRRYYPHGTAILNTLQQVAGAIGVALFISIMNAGQERYLADHATSLPANAAALALNSGVKQAFTVALVFAGAALVISLFIKRTQAPVES